MYLGAISIQMTANTARTVESAHREQVNYGVVEGRITDLLILPVNKLL